MSTETQSNICMRKTNKNRYLFRYFPFKIKNRSYGESDFAFHEVAFMKQSTDLRRWADYIIVGTSYKEFREITTLRALHM